MMNGFVTLYRESMRSVHQYYLALYEKCYVGLHKLLAINTGTDIFFKSGIILHV